MNAIEAAACLNCGRQLTGPYCASCGQKAHGGDLTFRELLHETTRELVHWDGKIPATLKALFFKPGLLTQDFLAGRRARWLPPLRLYLLCSIAFFVSKPLVEAITERPSRGIATITVTNPDGTTTLTPEALQELEAGLPARVFGRDRLLRAAANNAQLNREIDGVLPKGMFILLPLFAFFTRLAWRRRLPRYPAHLYLALHLHSAWFGAMTALAIVGVFVPSPAIVGAFGVAVFGYVVWYGLAAARRIFGDSWMKTIAKAAAITVAYSVCLFVLSLALLGYVLMRM